MILAVYDTSTGQVRAFYPDEPGKSPRRSPRGYAWVRVDCPYDEFRDRRIDAATVRPGETIRRNVDAACPKCLRLEILPGTAEATRGRDLDFETRLVDPDGKVVGSTADVTVEAIFGNASPSRTSGTLQLGTREDRAALPPSFRRIAGHEIPHGMLLLARATTPTVLGGARAVRVRE